MMRAVLTAATIAALAFPAFAGEGRMPTAGMIEGPNAGPPSALTNGKRNPTPEEQNAALRIMILFYAEYRNRDYTCAEVIEHGPIEHLPPEHIRSVVCDDGEGGERTYYIMFEDPFMVMEP